MNRFTDGETSLGHDQDRVAAYFVLALGEVATAYGGEALAAEVAALPTGAESTWPVNALALLKSHHPDAAEAAFSRAEALQREAHGETAE